MTHQFITQREKEDNGRLFAARNQAYLEQDTYRQLHPPATQTPEERAEYIRLLKAWKDAARAYHHQTDNVFMTG
jgi:hypothetical protein